MDDRYLVALILMVAAAPVALWARMAQSGRWIDTIVPGTAELSEAQRQSLAPMISTGLWLMTALLMTAPVAAMLLEPADFIRYNGIAAVVGAVLSAVGSALVARRIRAMAPPP
jgi:hypothetical protein